MTLCRDCQFWVGHETTVEAVDSGLNLGQCRRRAPVPLVIVTLEEAADGAFSAYWPETYGKDGCGEGMQV